MWNDFLNENGVGVTDICEIDGFLPLLKSESFDKNFQKFFDKNLIFFGVTAYHALTPHYRHVPQKAIQTGGSRLSKKKEIFT